MILLLRALSLILNPEGVWTFLNPKPREVLSALELRELLLSIRFRVYQDPQNPPTEPLWSLVAGSWGRTEVSWGGV